MNAQNFSGVDCITEAWALVRGSKWPFMLVCLTIIACKLALLIPFIGLIFLIPLFILRWSLAYLGVKRANGLNIQYNMVEDVFDLKIFIYIFGYYLLMFVFFLICFLPLSFFSIDLFRQIHNLYYIHHFSSTASISEAYTSVTSTSLTSTSSASLIQDSWRFISGLLYFLIIISIAAYLFVRLYLSTTIIIMEKLDPWSAIKKSFHATKSKVGSLSLLILLQCIFTFLAFIPLGIGLIWAIPLLYISMGVAYKKLINSSGSVP